MSDSRGAARRLHSTNPATGEIVGSYEPTDLTRLDDVIGDARSAQRNWARLKLSERSARLAQFADALERNAGEFTDLIVREVGKPRREASAEVAKCIRTCRYFVERSEAIFGCYEVDGPGRRNAVHFAAIGTVLAVMPWNFPLWQVVRFAAPAVLAGNAILLKHAPNTTGCALAIERSMHEAGFPPSTFQAILIASVDVPDTVARLIAHPGVDAVSFTGSSTSGAKVASAAGASIKKSLLELGGSDPFVVLEDADLDRAVAAGVASRFGNCGQSCLAAKRFIVHKQIAADFTELLTAAVERLVVGDPNDEATQLGPMAREDLRRSLVDQLDRSTAAGASIVTGGSAPSGPGWWFTPTVVIGVEANLDMPIFTEETFGPLAPIAVVDDDDHAVRLANRTPYGLGAAVWSSDIERAEWVGERIQSGALFVNAVVASDPRLPFGGVGRSGYGRELGTIGAREFTNVRTIVSDLTGSEP